ncbi:MULTISPECIES: DoxX family protein [unclassified Kaistella]|uniref:DoxX family protein n=1 Tax=unclassified Kaistella TaxID=2762626 RepID=UPI002735981F|nr:MULTISPECIES: DoxX family protein [unclassified Kaistella]MDP2454089.1 DoxX family protein [Kaistella sp. SH11-4b]MDP2457146.1 DoxX family protein [Kaistella sp. SH40-3]MDP2459904.1 DoxX family protein [Kaistella sp. SH19-2b]
MKITKIEIFNIFEWIAVYIVAVYMIIYGVSKPIQFGDFQSYKEPINTMDPMSLMWAFYSYSKPYVIIIGIFEVLGAVLLMIPRTRILGGFVLSSILINIILQDYSFKVHVRALVNAILFQVLILIILFKHRFKILDAFKILRGKFIFKIRWIYIPIGIVMIAVIELLMFSINYLIKFLNP